MGAFYETMPQSIQDWILKQRMFWIASAPLSGEGHVNVSPKGGDYFGIVDSRTFWYMDLTGSGIETTSHLHEPGNGRITVMFNAFDGAPKIVRLWGKGTCHEAGTPFFTAFVKEHAIRTIPGSRSIIIVDIHQVGSSCGFSMPLYEYKGQRETLNEFFAKKAEKERNGNEKENIELYWAYKNAWSMDKLPGLKTGVRVGKRESVEPIKKMVGPNAPKAAVRRAQSYSPQSIILFAIVCFLLGMFAAAYGPQILADRQDSLDRIAEILRRQLSTLARAAQLKPLGLDHVFECQ